MPWIEAGTKNILINVFSMEAEQQPAALRAFDAFGARVSSGAVPGLISATIHRSMDGVRVVNYVQWRSVEDMQHMLQGPEFQAAFAAEEALKRADFHFYEVAAVYQPGKPLDVYRRFQSYLLTGQFDRLPEVVDVEGYTENCVGLTGWTTGLHVALQNFQRGVAANLADMTADEQDAIEGADSVVIRSRVTATHSGPFLGIAPTGRRVTWDSVDLYRVRDGRIYWRFLLSDWQALVKQLS